VSFVCCVHEFQSPAFHSCVSVSMSRASPYDVSGGRNGTWTGFPSSSSVFSRHYHSTNAAYSSSYLYCF
jgi:hypothetical protein